jgi:hypothetical protein
VQTALGPLLHLEKTNLLLELGDFSVPKVAESLSCCPDGALRWQECVVVGYDTTSGMYHTILTEDLSREPGSSQNLSGYSTQLDRTPSFDSEPRSIGVGDDGIPSWRFRVNSSFQSSVELDDQRIPTRLVARLNIRLPEVGHKLSSFLVTERFTIPLLLLLAQFLKFELPSVDR